MKTASNLLVTLAIIALMVPWSIWNAGVVAVVVFGRTIAHDVRHIREIWTRD